MSESSIAAASYAEVARSVQANMHKRARSDATGSMATSGKNLTVMFLLVCPSEHALLADNPRPPPQRNPRGRPPKTANKFVMEALDESADGEKSKEKVRKKDRTLEILPWTGLGYSDWHAGEDYFPWELLNLLEFTSSYPRVFWLRSDVNGRGPSNSLGSGPFDVVDSVSWMLNRDKQADFASRFFVPVYNEEGCFRKLLSDKNFVRMDDTTSKVLFAATVTHDPTEVDQPRTHDIESVIIPQFHKDMLSVNALHGPEGGIVGRDTTCFWWMSVNEDLHITPKEFLKCVSTLCQIFVSSHSKTEPYWPGVNTNWTHLNLISRNIAISGARFYTQGNGEKLKQYHCRNTNEDIDRFLLDKIMDYRGVVKDDRSSKMHTERYNEILQIARHAETGDPNKENQYGSKTRPPDVDAPEVHNISTLFDAHLHIDVFKGLDAQGNFSFIKLHSFRITPKIPGIDPCSVIQTWWTQNQATNKREKKINIQNVINHMAQCVNQRRPSPSSFFNTDANSLTNA